ncbi:MAG TPA: vitamin K epoxide reductase family protein [Ktedonobacterales bacterium]
MDSARRLDEARGPSRLLALARAQPGLVAIALMGLVGLGISIYLTVVHYDAKVSLVCTSGGVVNCQQVTSSAWSVLPATSIPVTIPGMLWFVVSGGLALWALLALARGEMEPERARVAQLVWSGLGLAFVLYLVFAEIALVQRLCEWCTAVHLLTLATFLIALVRWQRRNEPAEALEPPLTATAPVRRAPQQALSRRARRTLEQRGGRTGGR